MKTIEEIKSTPKTVMKKPELLAPAGNLEKLKIAVHNILFVYIRNLRQMVDDQVEFLQLGPST
jgi:hypothetical protein